MTAGDHSGVKKIAIAATAVGAVGAAAAGFVSLDLPPWFIDELRKYGPVSFLAFGIAVGIKYYVPQDAVPKFLSAQQDAAVSIARVADQLQTLNGQSGKLDEIIAKIDDVKFNSDIFGDRLVRIEENMINGKRQNDVQ